MTWIQDGQPIHEYATCWCRNPGGTVTCWCHGEDGSRNLPPAEVLERRGLVRPAVKVTPEPRVYRMHGERRAAVSAPPEPPAAACGS